MYFRENDYITATATYAEILPILKKYRDTSKNAFLVTDATRLGHSREHLVISGALPVDRDIKIIENVAVPLNGIVFESLHKKKYKTISFMGRWEMLNILI